MDQGADITEVDQYGFNCLFIFMSKARTTNLAGTYKALQCLLSMFDGMVDEIFARDALGNDLFAYVNELQDWPDGYNDPWDCDGSYRQDLWYCALMRSKLDISYKIKPYTRIARYTFTYRPCHYLALRYLDDWDTTLKGVKFTEQICQIIEEHPMSLSEDEKAIELKFRTLDVRIGLAKMGRGPGRRVDGAWRKCHFD